MSQKIGFAAEDVARDYLRDQGLKWIESNYTCRLGEIDLIMHDKIHLIFIEVRARSSKDFGGALESITYSKQRKIIRTALLYLQITKRYEKQPIRFDVLTIDGAPPQIAWIKNAFGDDF